MLAISDQHSVTTNFIRTYFVSDKQQSIEDINVLKFSQVKYQIAVPYKEDSNCRLPRMALHRLQNLER